MKLSKNMLGIIILAAGKGTRLNSRIPKCLQILAGKPMIDYVWDNFSSLNPKQVVGVVGFKKKILMDHLGSKVLYAWQKQALGTAHAAMVGLKKLRPEINTVLVSNSDDACFYKKNTLKKFLNKHKKNNYNFSFLTVKLKNLPSVSAVIKRRPLRLERAGKQKLYEVVCGAYLFKRDWLEENLKKITPHSLTKEYYLTNLIYLALDESSEKVHPFLINAPERLGVNTLSELEKADSFMKKIRRK